MSDTADSIEPVEIEALHGEELDRRIQADMAEWIEGTLHMRAYFKRIEQAKRFQRRLRRSQERARRKRG